MKHEHAANMIRDMVLRDGIKITVRPAYEHGKTAIAIRVSRGMYNAERVLDLNHMDCVYMDPEAFVCEVLRQLARDILMSRYDDLVERAHEKKERPR